MHEGVPLEPNDRENISVHLPCQLLSPVYFACYLQGCDGDRTTDCQLFGYDYNTTKDGDVCCSDDKIHLCVHPWKMSSVQTLPATTLKVNNL